MAIVKADKEKAMLAGPAGTVDLGMAQIHENMLNKDKPEPLGPDLVADKPALPQYSGTQKAMNTENHAELQAKRADYDKRIQAALDLGTPEGREQAASLGLAKQHYDKMNGYGSAANHPGWFGKLEHGLAKAGNIAGNLVAPSTMSLIPGTELNKQERTAGYKADIAESTKEELEKAQATAASTKAPAGDKYTVKEVKDTRPNSPTFGQTVLAGVNNTDPTDVKFTGQTAAPKTDKPETAEEHKNTYAELRNRAASGEALSPEDQKTLQTLQTQLSVGADNATKFNDRLKDLNVPADQMSHYAIMPTDTDVEAKEKEAAARSLMEHTATRGDKADEAAGKVFDKYSANLDKIATPIDAASQRSSLLVHNLDAKNKQGDALVAPELLSIAAGGAGSGLRMNEAEISRVIGGRSVWDALIAKANSVQQGEGTFDDAQRGQLRAISAYINDRNSAQTALISSGREALLRDQGSEGKVRSTYEHVRQAISDIGSKGIAPSGSAVKTGDYVYHNGEVLKVTVGKDGKPHGTPIAF
jgi:hypothetical protein